MFVKEDIQQFAITTAVPASRNTTISCPFPIKKIVREGVTPYKITELPYKISCPLFLFNEFLAFALQTRLLYFASKKRCRVWLDVHVTINQNTPAQAQNSK